MLTIAFVLTALLTPCLAKPTIPENRTVYIPLSKRIQEVDLGPVDISELQARINALVG